MDEAEFARSAVDLYVAAAGRLEEFFRLFTSRFCADCLNLHREYNPDDPIARHEVVGGIFTGCCQEGVALDMRVDAYSGRRLPEWFVRELLSRRPQPPSPGPGPFRVRDAADGSVHEGRGCQWMGSCGCVLGPLKSPICLWYVCEPVRARLKSLGAALDEDGDDFLGFCSFLRRLSEIGGDADAGLVAARRALSAFEGRVERCAVELIVGANSHSDC